MAPKLLIVPRSAPLLSQEQRRSTLRGLLATGVLLCACKGDISGGVGPEGGAGEAEAGSQAARDGGASEGGQDSDAAASASCEAPLRDIFAADGTIDPEAYRALAAQLGGSAGLAYRYGPDSTCYHAVPEPIAMLWGPADKHFDNHGNGDGWEYQVAGPQDATKNDYSSNMAQVLYVGTAPGDRGVDTIMTLLMGENTFSEKPQPPWVYYGQRGHPEPNLTHDSWTAANGAPVAGPVALGRAYGYQGWGTESVIAFGSGFIGTAGSNTSDNDTFLKLPAGKHPSAVAVTGNNEFALVTVWDTEALKGQLAVIALGTGNEFWGDWKEVYPGLRSHGLWSFAKLLGFVDLPIAAPTEISASNDLTASQADFGWLVSPDGKDGRYQASQLTLSTEENRQSFVTGQNKDRYSRAGYAVVISKSERKAVFVDLKPLFEKVRQMYFTTAQEFARTRTVGQEPEAWPFTFDVSPDFAPIVVATRSFDERPTAVRTSLWRGHNQAYVATQDGTLSIFDVGGLADGSGASAEAIRVTGTLQVGHNPTAIAYAKHDPLETQDIYTSSANLIVVARGDRAVHWVSPAKIGAKILRTLKDGRMVDPVWAEDNDNHGTLSYVLNVADYSGHQVLGYRYGPVIFSTNGGQRFDVGVDGTADFEFGGAHPLSGPPFQLSGANVP